MKKETIVSDEKLRYKMSVTADDRMAFSYHTIDAENVNEAFLTAANNILKVGSEVSPRGMQTYEISPMMLRIRNPKDCVLSIKTRRMPYRFMAMELMWILSGDREPWIIDYLPRLKDYTNEVAGSTKLLGAYGPRLRHYDAIHPYISGLHEEVDQLQYVIDRLREDKDSRQAISVIWNPFVDTAKGVKDVPCTNLFKFSIRDNKLNMTTFMRSNDLWKGSSIDWFNFCTIQCVIADILGIEVGSYHHIADSLHIYKTDIELFDKVFSDSTSFNHGVPTTDGGTGYTSLKEVYEDVAYGRKLMTTKETPSNDRYFSRLMRWVVDHPPVKPLPKI